MILTTARHAVTAVNIELARPIINTKAKPLTAPVPTINRIKAVMNEVMLESAIVTNALA